MGRTLEEIEFIFRESPSILGTVRYARHRPRVTEDNENQKIEIETVHEEKISD